MENEIVTKNYQEITPVQMIMAAVSGQADLEKVKALLELQERWEANQARKAYHKAMSDFKANPPRIEKDKRVGYSTNAGKVGYSHASLGNVVEQITKELSKHGLSASWSTHQNGTISVTCRITHVLGHSEETTLTASSDKSGSKNDIQALGSTITYLERYSLLALTGLATYDQDDDGKSATVKITEQQLHQIRDLLISKELPEKKLLDYLKIENLEGMPSTDFMKAMSAINQARKVEK
jgi:hypothetical protein